jgi:hypothetical protein
MHHFPLNVLTMGDLPSTNNSTGLAAHLPALTLASRLTDEVLPPLKKGASTDNFTGLAANFPAPSIASRLTNEVLPPLKKGASTDNSTGLPAHLPAPTLASRLTNEVLPPLKKRASTDNSTGLAAHLPASTLASQPTDEATCVWIQDMLGLMVLLYVASEKWKWHEGHEYATPAPANVSSWVREDLLMFVDYCKSLVQLQVLDKKTSRMEVVQCR